MPTNANYQSQEGTHKGGKVVRLLLKKIKVVMSQSMFTAISEIVR